MEEKYFEIKEVDSKPKIIDFPIIMKLTEPKGKLELLTSKDQSGLERIGLRDSGKEYFVNEGYSVSEIPKEKADEIIREMDKKWYQWQRYMSNPDEEGVISFGGSFM